MAEAERPAGPLGLDMSKLQLQSSADEDGREHVLQGDIAQSPRAASEKVIETPRRALERARHLFALDASLHNSHPVEVAWGAGPVLATFGVTGEIGIWDQQGKRVCEPIKLVGANGSSGRSTLMWDSESKLLFVLADGIGLYIWSEASGLRQLANAAQSAGITFIKWSRTQPGLLAIGTDRGEIFLYSHHEKDQPALERQNAGKHPGMVIPGMKSDNQIVCGDWLHDGALALASGARLKVSEPITQANPRWVTFSKFRVHEMQAKIPQSKLSGDSKTAYRSTPFVVKTSRSSAPFIAMNLGDKVVTIMDYAGTYKEEGFFIPLDYGTIIGIEWLPGDVLVVGLSNGYIITVNVPLFLLARNNRAALHGSTSLPVSTSPAKRVMKAMMTTRVMATYMSDIKVSLDGTRLCVLGDSRVKELGIAISPNSHTIMVSVEIEFVLPFESKVGTFARKLDWGPEGILSVTSNLGHVFAFTARQ